MPGIEVIGLGSLNIDYNYQVDHILEHGEAIVNRYSVSPCGAAANTIYGLAKLGIKTGFTGAVGDDAAGKLLVEDFQGVAVDVSQIKVKPQATTGMAVCLSDNSGKRSLYVLPGANSMLTLEDFDLGYMNQARLLHITSFAGEDQFKVLLELARRLSPEVKFSFSPGMLYLNKGLKALDPILARTRVLFLNQDDITQVTAKDIISGVNDILEHGCQIIVVTLGKGVALKVRKNVTVTAITYVRDSEFEYIIEPGKQKTNLVDSAGAGDAFAAGFLYGMLKSKTIDECARCGDIVAQFSTAKPGARAGLPNLALLVQQYQNIYHEPLL